MFLINYGGNINEIKKLQRIVEEDNNEEWIWKLWAKERKDKKQSR